MVLRGPNTHLDLAVRGEDVTRDLFNANTTMHAHRRIYHHPDDGHLVPANAQELSAIGGRIDPTNPPPGLSPAP
jgi:hypothetical protein